jgi:hypothetical protein
MLFELDPAEVEVDAVPAAPPDELVVAAPLEPPDDVEVWAGG